MKYGSLYKITKRARHEQRKAVELENIAEGQREDAIAMALGYAIDEGTIEAFEELDEIKNRYTKLLANARRKHTIADKKLFALGEELLQYARFNNPSIVECMAVFMSYIEGERFIPAHSCEGGQNSVVIKRSAVHESELEQGYNGINPDISYDDLKQAFDNGEAILLDNGFSTVVELYNEIGKPVYSIGYYTYLHEFFNRLVLYRIENGMAEFDPDGREWVYAYMAEFLKMHPELAYKNKAKREAMLSGEQDQYTEGCTKLEMLRKGE